MMDLMAENQGLHNHFFLNKDDQKPANAPPRLYNLEK